jgi:hypothetical protein
MPRGRLARLLLLLALGACTERLTAPGQCPAFCPGGRIEMGDTVLTDVIVRDSAYPGYRQAHEGQALPVVAVPGIQSRAIFRTLPLFDSVAPIADDPLMVPIVVDSAELTLFVVHRDTLATNLTLRLYRLPRTIDSTSTFAQLSPWFADSLLDSVRVSYLLGAFPFYDSTVGDTVRSDLASGHKLRWDHATGILTLTVPLDTTQARFLAADPGVVAFGVHVAADSLAGAALGANEFPERDARIRWFYHYTIPDTVTTEPDSVVYTSEERQSAFDSFVLDPPTPPLDPAAVDTTLAVGGVPAVRSILRVAFPSFLRDTADVVRATLLLVPVEAVAGARGDSFSVVAHAVAADFGAKSPLSSSGALLGSARIYLGSADTVRLELTDLIRAWSFDTTAVTAFFLRQIPEAGTYSQIRFYSSRTAFRPTLRVTYVRRFPFGRP